MGITLSPIRCLGCFIVTTAVILVPFTVLYLVVSPEQSLSKRLAECIEYLESMYIALQEEGLSSNGSTERSNITINGSVLEALSPEARVFLKNTSRFCASTPLKTFFKFSPRLLDDPCSHRISYLISKGRSGVQFVLGVPTVKRDKESYLITTLQNITSSMDEAEQNETLIIVFIGETDMDYVSQVAEQIENQFANFLEIGLIEVIAPSQSYYSYMNTLQLINDSPDRVKRRSKQNLDYLFLMDYAQPKGTFYVQLEDEIFTTRGFITVMKKFAIGKTSIKESWLVVDFCQQGSIGKMFKSSELPWLIKFFQMFYNKQSVDGLLDYIIETKVCNLEKDQKHCEQEKSKYWIHYKPSLFQHIGTSSLKGKNQKLKDKQFGKISSFYPHHNPSATIKTSIAPYKNFELDRAYKGETYFRGLFPQPGDLIEFKFNEPVNLKQYIFRSGNTEHPYDRFYNTTVEVLPDSLSKNTVIRSIYNTTTDGFLIVGTFNPSGLAEGLIHRSIGSIKEIRLHVHTETENLVILNEIHLQANLIGGEKAGHSR